MRSGVYANISVVCTLVAFVGCATSNQSGSDVDAVIDGTRRVCSFAPTATSILALLNVPGAPAADQLVQKICKQVETSAAVESAGVGGKISVNIDGKVVTGVLTNE